MTIFDNTEYQIANLVFPLHKIIFKGKRTDNGESVEGFYFTKFYSFGTIEEHCAHIIQCKNSGIEYEVDPHTICQFIDKTDSDGKKLFICDIIKTKLGFGIIFYDAVTSQMSVRFDENTSIAMNILYETSGKIERVGSIFDDNKSTRNNQEDNFSLHLKALFGQILGIN